METYESGTTSFNTLVAFLKRAFGNDATDEWTVVGQTPGGDCSIHIDVHPDTADEKIEKHELFESATFEELPEVTDVKRDYDDGFILLDVKS